MSAAELRKVEAERARLTAELAALQGGIPTAAACDDLAAYVARTHEPMAQPAAQPAPAASSAAAGGASAGAAANPWTAPPPAGSACPSCSPWQCSVA